MTEIRTVALISKSDFRGGGASRVADDIWKALRSDKAFRPQRYISEFSAATDDAYRPIGSRAPKTLGKLRYLLRKRGYVDHYPVELPFLDPGIRKADIIHAHDITTAMAPQTLHLLAKGGRRVIWTMHDMSPITGGCIYPLGCSAWKTGCGPCPMLDHWPFGISRDRTDVLHARRLEILRQKRIELVSPSRWLAEQVEVIVPGVTVRVIPNGVDIETFSPAPAPEAARRSTVPKLMFIANHLRDMRKGGTHLADIRRFTEETGRELELLMVGSGSNGEVTRQGQLTLRFLGRIDNQAELAAAYRAADALLLPTYADNFPLVTLEAMACGRPVFGFATGGIAEAVDASCGATRPTGDIRGVLEAFFAAVDAGTLPSLGAAARARVEEKYSMAAFAQAHRQLYTGR